ncbi:MAG: tetratricopeptide repeat protein [Deltaproteobacteria bacterium]|nr:tetratricopeptide repeat protein [Deltaproteobacteria bacterium]
MTETILAALRLLAGAAPLAAAACAALATRSVPLAADGHAPPGPGKKELDLDLMKAELADEEAVLGQDHPEVIVKTKKLGRDMLKLGQFEAAAEAMSRLSSSLERLFGPDDPGARSADLFLGLALLGSGDNAGARELLVKVADGACRESGGTSSTEPFCLGLAGLASRRLDETEASEAAFGRASEGYARLFGPAFGSPASAEMLMAVSAEHVGLHDAALELLALAVEKCAKNPDSVQTRQLLEKDRLESLMKTIWLPADFFGPEY